jgi:Lecithin retinol acyltransferase
MSIHYTHRLVYSTGEQIAVGDWVKVFVPKLGVWHHGSVRRIYPFAGGLAVAIAHNMKESGVTISDWYDFADGGVVVLERHAYSAVHVGEIVARVDVNVGKPYHLFAQNCEHFASFAFTGKSESKSVQVVGGIAVFGILAALFFGD